MYKEKRSRIRSSHPLLTGICLAFVLLYGCGEEAAPASAPSGQEAVTENAAEQREKELSELTAGETSLSVDELSDYALDVDLVYDAEMKKLRYTLTMPLIPSSDDAYLYLFRADTWEEDADALEKEPVTRGRKDREWEIGFPYRDSYLYERFIPAVKMDGNYVQVGRSVYMSNPEALAENQEPYPENGSKKGILLDPTMLGTPELTDLGVKHAI